MKHNRKPRLCFVSSSGGHWEQLQKLEPLAKKYEGFFVTEKTQFDAPLGKYFMKQTDLKDKFMIPKMLWNSIYTLYIWVKERPDFVITTGTMVAYPFYLLAVLFHKKICVYRNFRPCKYADCGRQKDGKTYGLVYCSVGNTEKIL